MEPGAGSLVNSQAGSLRYVPQAFCARVLAAFCCQLLLGIAIAAEPAAASSAKFLGAAACASSGCHGGAGENQNQFLVWSTRDFHSQRPFATLTTARSRQIGEALGIRNPTTDTQCTSCHAPLHEVPETLRSEELKVSEGVSCESCHGPAENWVRAHTRKDWTQADRVAAGMRDLKNLYVRANSCVACHQVLPTSVQKAGHPELLFELDGQSASQPKHWREEARGGQAWFIGQAVALREMSWQLSRESNPDAKLVARWNALVWLFQELNCFVGPAREFSTTLPQPAVSNVLAIWSLSDQIARSTGEVASIEWKAEIPGAQLRTLLEAAADFQDASVPAALQARRAERLVLALERLSLAARAIKPGSEADVNLNQLFKLVQSLPDFDSAKFAEELKKFAEAMGK